MNHHPDHEWLQDYASGALPVPLALGVSVHLHFCAECRRQVEMLQGLGAELLQELAPANIDDEVFARVLQAIDNFSADAAAPGAAINSEVAAVPKPLRQWIPGGYESLNWKRALPGLRVAILPLDGDSGYRVALHRMKPGGRVAMHDHRGAEVTLVLNGTFSDEAGLYGDGDFVLRQPSQRHEPIAAQNEECICLTVQEAPVRFTGWLWRWLNPLLR